MESTLQDYKTGVSDQREVALNIFPLRPHVSLVIHINEFDSDTTGVARADELVFCSLIGIFTR